MDLLGMNAHWWIALFVAFPVIHHIVAAICILLPALAMIRGRFLANFCFWMGMYFLFDAEHFNGLKLMNVAEKEALFHLHQTMLPCYIVGIVVWFIEYRLELMKKQKGKEEKT